MRSIEGSITPQLAAHVGPMTVDKADAYGVRTYRELMGQVAKLAYFNKDHLLFFRGQTDDYKNRAGSSTFYPAIYRDDYLPSREVHYRYELLNQASKLLVTAFEEERIEGYKETKRKRYIQWSILQHYEVCRTPLLDFTHSVRVACSFAQLKNQSTHGYVFVFGLPYVTNRISTNSEHDLVNVRLLSICPPDALRPYYQDGYLVGTEDITTEYESKTELDFKNRLIAKFRIPPTAKFWGKGFSAIPETALYPRGDRIQRLCSALKVTLDSELQPGDMGEFLKLWVSIEEILQELGSRIDSRRYSVREAIANLAKVGGLPTELVHELHRLRKFRNQLVHRPKTIEPGETQANVSALREILPRIS